MIRNAADWQRFQDNLVRDDKTNYERNLAMVEAILQEAIALGRMPPEDPLDGIETCIRIARVVNSVPDTPGKAGD